MFAPNASICYTPIMRKPNTTGFNDEWPDEDRAYDTSLDCDHAEADLDIVTGELHCRCGYLYILTGEQLKREAMLQAEMMEVYSRECEQTERDAMAAT